MVFLVKAWFWDNLGQVHLDHGGPSFGRTWRIRRVFPHEGVKRLQVAVPFLRNAGQFSSKPSTLCLQAGVWPFRLADLFYSCGHVSSPGKSQQITVFILSWWRN